MNKCAWKYFFKFAIRNFILIFGSLSFISLVIIVAAIVQGKLSTQYGFLNTLLIFGAVIFVLSNLFIFKFGQMIKKQQLEHAVIFNDNNAKKLGYLVYLSDDWLIDCGMRAILRKTITNINYDFQHGLRGGTSLKVTINTTNGKRYYINLKDEYQVQKLKLWATYSDFEIYKND